jgi:choline dehydrogenase-like flavoprotein
MDLVFSVHIKWEHGKSCFYIYIYIHVAFTHFYPSRMGISPKVSVAKPTGETWEVKNLYVADASLLPTATGVNPMVTTEALCLHVADSILNKNTSKL